MHLYVFEYAFGLESTFAYMCVVVFMGFRVDVWVRRGGA